ncbi:MAG: Ig-like domain-containing protein, partial [Moraxellaceae bacterium]|nr:Ig-like domain-containing protein [Moraxellaceae bacterium]
MSWLWPRRSLVAALLAFNFPLAFADTVIVNTVTDDNANNTLCSLREAVEYFNLDKHKIEDPEGATETLAKYQGCKRDGSASEQHVIRLPKEDTPYLITAAAGGDIVVKRGITINGGDDNDTERTKIVVSGGGHRAFKVDDPNTPFNSSWLTPPPPAGAPSLADGSDSGAADRYTSVLAPVVEGSGVPADHIVEVYVKPDGGDAVSKGWIQANASGEWFLTLGALSEGLYEVYITTRAPDGPEGVE